uniref:Putative secreted protein n=1 Tax=Ixodes ricinus TaxID=34613 RepID=A0A6B0U7G2_IXORI
MFFSRTFLPPLTWLLLCGTFWSAMFLWSVALTHSTFVLDVGATLPPLLPCLLSTLLLEMHLSALLPCKLTFDLFFGLPVSNDAS